MAESARDGFVHTADANSTDEKKHSPLPGYNENGHNKDAATTVSEEDWMTRNGLNLKSFQKRDYGRGIVELDRAMKGRHLHMIAIGGSIGAGFFVGSGGALSRGGPASLFICFLIVGIMIFNVFSPSVNWPSCTPFPVASTRTRLASSTPRGVSPWAGIMSSNGPSFYH